MFDKYFKKQEYLGYFEDFGPQHLAFARTLVASQQFVHFCDDFFADVDLSNFKMLREILKARGDSAPEETLLRNKSSIFDGFNFDQEAGSNRTKWPEQEPVVFNVRMPQGAQRLMLFDKILFMNEKSMRKKERDITRKTNASIVKNKDGILYEKYIADVKKLYPIKLKNLHRLY